MIVHNSQLNRFGRFSRFGVSMPSDMPGYNTTPPIIAIPETPTGVEDTPAALIGMPGVVGPSAPMPATPAPEAKFSAGGWAAGAGVLIAIAWALGR